MLDESEHCGDNLIYKIHEFISKIRGGNTESLDEHVTIIKTWLVFEMIRHFKISTPIH